MSNWALELQCFDIVRIWIRGEANILADAPSRAPWEAALAKHLPIPDLPVRELVRKMYQEPEALEDLVSQRRSVLTGEAEWTPLVHDEVRGPALRTSVRSRRLVWLANLVVVECCLRVDLFGLVGLRS